MARGVISTAAAALTLSSPAQAGEVSPTQVRETIKATADDLFAMAEFYLRRGQRSKAEQLLRLLSRDPSSEVRNRARLRQSLLLQTRGANNAAAVLLRTILDERPEATAVRLRLAVLLADMGDEEAALRELRAVNSANLPTAIARLVHNLAGSLRESKPFGVRVEFALAQDSNLNRATRSETLGTIFGDFIFDEDARAKSGAGISVRALAHARIPLQPDLDMVARPRIDLSIYGDQRFNDITTGLSVGPELRLGRTRLSADAGIARQWYGMRAYQTKIHISGGASHALNAVSQGRIAVSLRSQNNLMNNLQDGQGVSVGARYDRAISPRLSVALTAAGDRFGAADQAYSTTSWGAGLHVARETGRFTFSAGAELGGLKADKRLAILPRIRDDNFARFTIGATARQLGFAGFAPIIRLVVERNRSTVEFYDYRATRAEFGVARAF